MPMPSSQDHEAALFQLALSKPGAKRAAWREERKSATSARTRASLRGAAELTASNLASS